MRIFIIGLPGCGKTTIAKLLANRLHYKFIDIDTAIEAKENMTINEIFKNKGESYFRTIETQTLNDLNQIEDVVIACGGGICENNSKSSFKGITIFLKVDVKVLERRLANDTTRPLLKTNSIYQLAIKRNDKYANLADLTIENTNIDTTVETIIEVLNENFSN